MPQGLKPVKILRIPDELKLVPFKTYPDRTINMPTLSLLPQHCAYTDSPEHRYGEEQDI